MKLSDSEKLILVMLAEIHKHLGIEGGIDPDFVQEAIHSGNVWGLQWQYRWRPSGLQRCGVRERDGAFRDGMAFARRTSPRLPSFLGSGSTACTGGVRLNSSCSTWILARARSTASRRGAPTTVISAAPAITRCSYSTSSAIWSGARCGPAMFTAPMNGRARCARWLRAIPTRSRACIFAPTLLLPCPMCMSSKPRA